MMELAINHNEESGEINWGALTFNSGKKIILDAGETKEVLDKMKMAKVEGKSRAETSLVSSQKALEEALDWHTVAPIEEIEAVETAIEFNFPSQLIIQALVEITEESGDTVTRKSFKRGNNKMNEIKCPKCGGTRFMAHQQCYHDVIVDGDNNFEEDKGIYESNHPYGPYSCIECGEERDILADFAKEK